MDEDGNELELGSADGRDGDDRQAISEIKSTDLPFTTERLMNRDGWSHKRYLAALIGKSARAAQGAYEYTRPHGHCGGIGHSVEALEGEESE